MSNSAELIDVACRMADAARAATLRYFRQPQLAARNKAAAGFDPVTEADDAAERAMRAILAERRPEDGILGEEQGEAQGSSGLTWVLDPIDGTRAFMAGTPSWGVLIALDAGEGPILGLIDQPWTGERFFGGFGEAWLERERSRTRLAVRRGTVLSDAILFSTFPEIGTEREREGFQAVSAQVRLTRFGFDCYAYALLAAGHVDLVIEAGLARHDIQAPLALIEAAGGIVTNWRGGPAHGGGRVIAAGDPGCHAQALALLSQVPD